MVGHRAQMGPRPTRCRSMIVKDAASFVQCGVAQSAREYKREGEGERGREAGMERERGWERGREGGMEGERDRGGGEGRRERDSERKREILKGERATDVS